MDIIPLLTRLWQPAHFYLSGLRCAWQFEAEQTLAWELFRGQLVEPRQTRQLRTFLTWNLYPVENGALDQEPLLSILFDEPAGEVHVTRGLKRRVWTAVDAAEGIESRQSVQCVRELVGTIGLRDAGDRLAGDVCLLIHQAIVGASRLPLTSVEAPLPQFTFGQLAYLPLDMPENPEQPRRHWSELLLPSALLNDTACAKLLETLLRTAGADIATPFAEWLGRPRLAVVFRRMFNDVSLSPYTGFVDAALGALAEWRLDDEIDVLSGLLLQITRHLTAYDLVLFHYRGANYPDALLLDAVLRRLLELAARAPDAFLEPAGRRRRRALRMGCLLRGHYEGHAVPDQPTSPGEHQRLLPEAFAVPEEQILEPHRRSRRLFAGAPLESLLTGSAQGSDSVVAGLGPATTGDDSGRAVLTQACLDLTDDIELREGGLALFIDRPLGFFKAAAEVDRTPLLSYLTFSRRVAMRRLLDLEKLAGSLALDVPASHWRVCGEKLAALETPGLALDRVPDSPRPAVTLADARKVADDFVALRTTASSREMFWRSLGMEIKPWPLIARIIGTSGQPVLGAFDETGQLAAEFDADWSQGSLMRGGVELPRAGLRPPLP